MRSIEYLAQLFPDKTGKELFELQKQDKQQDEIDIQERHKENYAIRVDIETNGGYYRGTFGMDQHHMYKVTKINIGTNDHQIYCEVERITLFFSQDIDKGSLYMESKIIQKEFITYEDIASMTTRITEEEYNELKNYLFGVVPKFFNEEWEMRQKEFGKPKN